SLGQVMTAGSGRPCARASAIASISAGWSLPKFAKIWETPASANDSRSALLAVYMAISRSLRQRVRDPAQQGEELRLAPADDGVEPAVVRAGMGEQVGQRRLAGAGQGQGDAAAVGDGGPAAHEAVPVQLLHQRRHGRLVARDGAAERGL